MSGLSVCVWMCVCVREAQSAQNTIWREEMKLITRPNIQADDQMQFEPLPHHHQNKTRY